MGVSCFMLVGYESEVKITTEGVQFCGSYEVAVKISSSMTLSEIHSIILENIHLENKQIIRMMYRVPTVIGQSVVRYEQLMIKSDDDVRMMFDCHARFPEVRVMEAFIALGDSHLSSEGSKASAMAVPSHNNVIRAENEDVLISERNFAQPAMPVPLQNENVRAENEDDLISGSSSEQVAGEIPQNGPNAGYDMNVDEGDSEDQMGEGPSRNENVRVENEDDVISDSSSKQDAPNAGCDLNVDEGNVEDQAAEVLCNKNINDKVPIAWSESLRMRTQTQPQSQSHQVRHYSSLNIEAMQVRNSPMFNGVDGGNTMRLFRENELYVGQRFPNKNAVLLAVNNYTILRGVEYKVFKSNQRKYHGKCKHFGNGCNWSILVIYLQKNRLWEIQKYNGEHGCLSTRCLQDLPQLNVNIIATNIHSMVEVDPAVPISVLQESVQSKYGFEVSYGKVWLAKQNVIAQIHGDWEESYNELARWLYGLEIFIYPKTSFSKLLTQPYHVGNINDNTCVMFHRVFWTFPQCIEAFRYCKPFISIDSMNLYGKYGERLLIAIAHDGDSNILPIAFALVEEETTEAWSFFLKNLHQRVTPKKGILIVSDSNDAILAALNAEDSGWRPPRAHHAYCIHHIVSNFAHRLKSKSAKQALTNATYSKTREEFVYYYRLLIGENPDVSEWIDKIDVKKWTQHLDEGRRFGNMTTNLSECLTGIMKGVRNLPVAALVKATYSRLAEQFMRKGRVAQAQLAAGQIYSQALIRAIEINKQTIGTMIVFVFSQRMKSFVVEEQAPTGNLSKKKYLVKLVDRWCSCGHFQALHYPCRHALAACAYARLDWGAYVHDVYRMQTVYNVYKTKFALIVDDIYWPPPVGPRIRPNPELRRAKEGLAGVNKNPKRNV